MLQIWLKRRVKSPEKDTKSNKDLMNFHMHHIRRLLKRSMNNMLCYQRLYFSQIWTILALPNFDKLFIFWTF